MFRERFSQSRFVSWIVRSIRVSLKALAGLLIILPLALPLKALRYLIAAVADCFELATHVMIIDDNWSALLRSHFPRAAEGWAFIFVLFSFICLASAAAFQVFHKVGDHAGRPSPDEPVAHPATSSTGTVEMQIGSIPKPNGYVSPPRQVPVPLRPLSRSYMTPAGAPDPMAWFEGNRIRSEGEYFDWILMWARTCPEGSSMKVLVPVKIVGGRPVAAPQYYLSELARIAGTRTLEIEYLFLIGPETVAVVGKHAIRAFLNRYSAVTRVVRVTYLDQETQSRYRFRTCKRVLVLMGGETGLEHRRDEDGAFVCGSVLPRKRREMAMDIYLEYEIASETALEFLKRI